VPDQVEAQHEVTSIYVRSANTTATVFRKPSANNDVSASPAFPATFAPNHVNKAYMEKSRYGPADQRMSRCCRYMSAAST